MCQWLLPDLLTPYQLFQRPNSSAWYMRYSVPGTGRKKRSLGRSDCTRKHGAKPITFGRKRPSELSKACRPTQDSSKDVVAEFIEDLVEGVKQGRLKPYHTEKHPAIIKRYFTPFFGSQPIEDVIEADFQPWIRWRRSYWQDRPVRTSRRSDTAGADGGCHGLSNLRIARHRKGRSRRRSSF